MADWILTPCNVAGGSGMTCHWIRPNVRHIGIIHLVRFRPYHRSRHVILHQSAKFYSNRTTLGRKMTSCRFSRWRISAILDFRGPNPIMGSLKSPRTTCYRSSIDTIAHSLVFEQIAFLYFGDRQTDKQTDEQTDSLVAWSRSRYRGDGGLMTDSTAVSK